MDSKRTVAVFGATGNIGGSVARALRDFPDFHVRAITRDPSSKKASELAGRNIEVVKADLSDSTSLDAALKGCWGVFLNTDSVPGEYEMGKAVVDSVVRVGIQMFVYAALAPAEHFSSGPYTMELFQTKWKIQQYAFEKKDIRTATSVIPAFFLENNFIESFVDCFGGFPHRMDHEGYHSFVCATWGNDPEIADFIAVEADYGDIVLGAMIKGSVHNRAVIHAVSDRVSPSDYAAAFQKVTGKPSRYVQISIDEMQGPDPQTRESVQGMYQFLRDSKGLYFGEPINLDLTRELKAIGANARGKSGPEQSLMTVEGYFKQNFS